MYINSQIYAADILFINISFLNSVYIYIKLAGGTLDRSFSIIFISKF